MHLYTKVYASQAEAVVILVTNLLQISDGYQFKNGSELFLLYCSLALHRSLCFAPSFFQRNYIYIIHTMHNLEGETIELGWKMNISLFEATYIRTSLDLECRVSFSFVIKYLIDHKYY